MRLLFFPHFFVSLFLLKLQYVHIHKLGGVTKL